MGLLTADMFIVVVLVSFSQLIEAQSCSSSRLCERGNCCSKYGYCGNTIDYCGNDCRSQCTPNPPSENAGVGVNYGTLGDNLPQYSEVVQLIKSLPIGVGRVKIFDSSSEIIAAFVGSGLKLAIAIPNGQINAFASGSAASNWVQQIVVQFASTIDIIIVGNELDNGGDWSNLIPAMRKIREALSQSGLQTIKVTTPVTSGVLEISYPPSQGNFRGNDFGSIIPQLLDFLESSDSPFMVNVYPYFSWKGDQTDISLDYALFRSTQVVVQDGNYGYTNLFDAMVDAIIAALERAGRGNMEVVIGESGWPSNGGPGASLENARQHNSKLVSKLLANQGTPRRPDRAMTAYIFALFNENKKDGDETERNFGLLYPDGSPVYMLSPTTDLGLSDI